MNSLAKAYRKAIYEINSQPKISITIGKTNLDLHKIYRAKACNNGAFITAYNPNSQLLSPNINRFRHFYLQKKLNSHLYLPAISKDPNGIWPAELGFWVCGITLNQAKHIGQSFAQNAIVYADKNTIAKLIWL